jgi:tRNA-Thr(GGU) m(6)t(6)A37 methyltransferase TsaA
LQGDEGAPEAWIQINDQFKDATQGLAPGSSILLFTWFHLADRETLKCYPRNNYDAPHVGVFTTRSPDRPNPIGLHRVKILEVQNLKLKVHPLEALDGTIVIDLKPVLSDVTER